MTEGTAQFVQFEADQRGDVEFEDKAATQLRGDEEDMNDDLIGRVAAPPHLEATPDQFHFWIARGLLIENSQFVRTESVIEDQRIEFFGVIDEVRRASRKRDILEEYDTADGDARYEPPFKTDGVTYARVNILRSQPDRMTPPIEQSLVYLGGETEAQTAYGFAEMSNPMPIGLLKNGASNYAGLANIDLAYLLGENGGHLNVNGMAGVGTKTSFLLTVIKLLLHQAELSRKQSRRLFIAPIILNVKGEDLMFINKRNAEFKKEHEADWEKLGIKPEPFESEFYAPTDPASGQSTINGSRAIAYSWSLANALEEEVLPFLFSEEDGSTEIMLSLVREIVARITKPDGKTIRDDSPKTWRKFLDWVKTEAEDSQDKMYGKGTWRAIYRRLSNMLDEGKNIFLLDQERGQPLRVTRTTSSPPQVIDINRLPLPIQRFVVASILKQVVNARSTGTPISGLRYVIMLDELNRFAPRGGRDEITRLLERVATEMRSQGVILLGAQQMASQVSTKVVEMASIRVLGRTGSAELQDKVWQSWEKSARLQASILQPTDKLVTQPTFRQPMLVKVPFPAWAMKREQIAADPNKEVFI